MSYLQEVVFGFDTTHRVFVENFFRVLQNVIEPVHSTFYLKSSHALYLPKICMNTNASEHGIHVHFVSADWNTVIEIQNVTGCEKASAEKYCAIRLTDLCTRFKGHDITITKIDHIGFNLPWFTGGIHPTIQTLRTTLSKRCLYHTFPSGEPWDFILPGLQEEIDSVRCIDYHSIRKPKLELVSFDKSSTPIIQFDVCCSCKKNQFQRIFPEGLYDQELGNMWVYIMNPFGIDICLVLNEEYEGDWSEYFTKNRIIL